MPQLGDFYLILLRNKQQTKAERYAILLSGDDRMGRPQATYSTEERKEVRQAYRSSKDVREKQRLLCL
ncbi:MAG: hypothetical protein LBI19_05535, partial [Oscillospiraceae bacterium]|nr:hypothetical protein [Oscillospiraceae bacterium]